LVLTRATRRNIPEDAILLRLVKLLSDLFARRTVTVTIYTFYGLPIGLQNLAALQNSTGLNLSGSTGGTATDINQTNLQGLATLANLSVANPSMYPDFELKTLLFIYPPQYDHGVSFVHTVHL
jgi:hypothetical protein